MLASPVAWCCWQWGDTKLVGKWMDADEGDRSNRYVLMLWAMGRGTIEPPAGNVCGLHCDRPIRVRVEVKCRPSLR